jgi:sec-independent protein translocase protein TatB
MFEIGFPELVLVAVIGLLVLGPQRLPKVAAEIGKWVSRARRTATQLRRQLEREIELSDIEPPPPGPPPAPPKPAAAPPATPTAESPSSVQPPPDESADVKPPSDSPVESSGLEPADRPPV